MCAFPVYTAQAPGCSIWSGPCIARGSSFRVPHKSADSVGPAFCAFPAGAAQAARSLPGALSPVRCAFSPPRPQHQFLRAGWVRLVSVLGSWPLTTQNLRKSLVRNWEPVCSLVWVPSLGPSLPLSPPPCLLPLAGYGPVRSRLALLWNCSVLPLFCEQARSVFRQVNFLSLSCHPPV